MKRRKDHNFNIFPFLYAKLIAWKIQRVFEIEIRRVFATQLQ